MALFGVSGSDVKTAGYNAAVGLIVAGSCFAVAIGVKKFAMWAFDKRNPTPETGKRESAETWTSRGALALGLAASYAASVYLPGSRYALIATNSTRELLKLGAIQAVCGLFIDGMAHAKKYKGLNPTFTELGVGVALASFASRYSSIAVLGFSAFGALIGAGYINK